jgi:hypothetical protein
MCTFRKYITLVQMVLFVVDFWPGHHFAGAVEPLHWYADVDVVHVVQPIWNAWCWYVVNIALMSPHYFRLKANSMSKQKSPDKLYVSISFEMLKTCGITVFCVTDSVQIVALKAFVDQNPAYFASNVNLSFDLLFRDYVLRFSYSYFNLTFFIYYGDHIVSDFKG